MKKKFKKLLAVVTAAAMLVSLSACGGGDKDSGTETKGKDSVTFNIDWPAAIDPGVGSKSADTIAVSFYIVVRSFFHFHRIILPIGLVV